MRRVVVFDSYRQSDIKPLNLFDKYLEISRKEVKRLLIDKCNRMDVKCPACNSNKRKIAFKKFGLDYVECMRCGTLYISPRPSEEAINRYFLESKATDFWNKYILKKTGKGRAKHLVKPEVAWVASTTEEFFARPELFVDIKSRHAEFIEEIDNLNLFKTKIIIDPEIATQKTLDEREDRMIVRDSIWNVDTDSINANVITSFYVIDRIYDPSRLLKTINSMLVDGGLLFLVSSTISGLDLQILWENAKTIFPPENMNIFSIEGIKILLEKSGFEIVELSTPGHLDIESIKNAMKRNEKLEVPRFISYIIKNRDESAHRSLQEFLQEFRLSSHLRIVARKR